MNFIYKPFYWSYRFASGAWYWLRRRFTLAGLCVLGSFVVAGAMGADIENTVLYQSFSLLLALLVLALANSFFFRATFSATRSLPRLGTAGQPLRYHVQIKNLTAKTQAGLILIEEAADPRPTFQEWSAFQLAENRRVRPFHVAQRRRRNPFRLATLKEAEVPPLAANGETKAQVEILPLRRGILHFTGLTLARPDPLGIFRAFSKIAAPQTILILPRRYPIPPIALPGALRYQEGGVALAANVGRSEEFVALREYRHGDPLRHIHWRSWAKVGKPIVKEFEDEFFVRHALVLDTFDEEPNSELLEEAVSVAASFACTALTQESLLDLLFVGNQSYCFTAGRGLGYADQMLEILAAVKNCADKKFESLEQLVLNHIAAVSGCICVLQRWDEERQKLVEKLRTLNIPLLVLVVIQPGGKKPDAGPLRDEPENFRVLEIGRTEEELGEIEMKTPPFLLFAALLFWGWQSGFIVVGTILGTALEGARLIRLRWDLTEEDFRRVWNLCMLLALGLIVYTFSTGGTGGGPKGLLPDSAAEATRNIGVSATIFLRWLPATLFLFIAAQRFSERETVPMAAISFFARRRKDATTAEQSIDVSYPYFIVCLFSAGIHSNEGTHDYFWGLAVLLAWALWPLRSRRFTAVVWASALALVIALGFSSQHGIGELQRLAEGYNAQWMASFMRHRTDASQSETAIGQIGKIKLSARIVIRLEPKDDSPPPGYLREASYRSYHSRRQAWYSGEARSDFAEITHETGNESSWTLLPGKTNKPAVNIACYLEGWSQELSVPEGLLPLPTGSGQLKNVPLSVAAIKVNKTGAVLVDGPGLMIFDAYFGPGATFDSPPDMSTNHLDLQVPTNEVPALDKIISEIYISGATEQRKLLAVQQFFVDKFSYSTWLGPDKAARTNETALARFLLESRSGHCEYFATATVLLLRELGIPARYAVGYAVHEPSGHGYVVRERDAHAWCLVWDERTKIWQDFDTTPASWIAVENNRASALQWLSDSWSWVKFQIAKFRWGQVNLRQYLLWALVPVLAFLLFRIIFRQRRKRRVQAKNNSSGAVIFWPGFDSEFYALERQLAARGVPRLPSEPLAGWLARALAEPALADLRKPLQELLQLHYRHRFDPRGLNGPERETLMQEAKICLDTLTHLEQRRGNS